MSKRRGFDWIAEAFEKNISVPYLTSAVAVIAIGTLSLAYWGRITDDFLTNFIGGLITTGLGIVIGIKVAIHTHMVTKRRVDGLDAEQLLRTYHFKFQQIVRENDRQIDIHLNQIPRHTWYPSVSVFEATVVPRHFLLRELSIELEHNGSNSLVELIDRASENLQYLTQCLRELDIGSSSFHKRKAAKAAYGEFLLNIISESVIFDGGVGGDPEMYRKRDELRERMRQLPRFCNEGVNGDCIRAIDAIERAMRNRRMEFVSFRESNPERFASDSTEIL